MSDQITIKMTREEALLLEKAIGVLLSRDGWDDSDGFTESSEQDLYDLYEIGTRVIDARGGSLRDFDTGGCENLPDDPSDGYNLARRARRYRGAFYR